MPKRYVTVIRRAHLLPVFLLLLVSIACLPARRKAKNVDAGPDAVTAPDLLAEDHQTSDILPNDLDTGSDAITTPDLLAEDHQTSDILPNDLDTGSDAVTTPDLLAEDHQTSDNDSHVPDQKLSDPDLKDAYTLDLTDASPIDLVTNPKDTMTEQDLSQLDQKDGQTPDTTGCDPSCKSGYECKSSVCVCTKSEGCPPDSCGGNACVVGATCTSNNQCDCRGNLSCTTSKANNCSQLFGCLCGTNGQCGSDYACQNGDCHCLQSPCDSSQCDGNACLLGEICVGDAIRICKCGSSPDACDPKTADRCSHGSNACMCGDSPACDDTLNPFIYCFVLTSGVPGECQ